VFLHYTIAVPNAYFTLKIITWFEKSSSISEFSG